MIVITIANSHFFQKETKCIIYCLKMRKEIHIFSRQHCSHFLFNFIKDFFK